MDYNLILQQDEYHVVVDVFPGMAIILITNEQAVKVGDTMTYFPKRRVSTWILVTYCRELLHNTYLHY